MKYALILTIVLIAATDSFAQHHYTYNAGFTPHESPFFRAPIGSKVHFTTQCTWHSDIPGPDFYPGFDFDSSSITMDSIKLEWENSGNGVEDLDIVVKSDTPRCLIPLDLIIRITEVQDQNLALYIFQGVFFDPRIIGKIVAPDSLSFGSVHTDSMARNRLEIINHSNGVYRQVKVLSVNAPFSLDDTIEMMYRCEENYTPNCYFKPTKPGHYVDTTKLLDELTKDTISIILIGDSYDAGVSDIHEPEVKFYPNPCDRQLRIESLSEPSGIEIRNLFGERVYHSNLSDATVDCSQLINGLYFVLIQSGNSRVTKKLIVAH